MKVSFYFLLLLSSLIFFSCNRESKDSQKNKELEHTPVNGDGSGVYALPDLDHGLSQSPINILTNEAKKREHHVKFNFDAKINRIENLGHTVQLDFEPGSVIMMDEFKYELQQIHFHTPSEHLVDGITFPMEMHVVNVLNGPEEGQATKYLVLSFLFKMGDPNIFIDEFINDIPNTAHSEHVVPTNQVSVEDFLPKLPDGELHEWYHYLGSLTTPPYTESVNWYVFKHVYTASMAQIQKINTIEGNNARHVQALNARVIEVEEN